MNIFNTFKLFTFLLIFSYTNISLAMKESSKKKIYAEEECCICLDLEPSEAFSCGHKCCCFECYQLVLNSNKLCPLCKVPNIEEQKSEFEKLVEAKRIGDDLILRIIQDDTSNLVMHINDKYFKDFKYDCMNAIDSIGNFNFSDPEFLENTKKYGMQEAMRIASMPQNNITLKGFYKYNDDGQISRLKNLMFIMSLGE